jgi:uncharacterized protein YjbI with pentapeptide repeats
MAKKNAGGGEIINFAGADLSGRDLREYDLQHINFRGAKFGGANLHHSDLSNSDLAATSFIEANLTGAKISRAHVNCADFTKANLSYARFNHCSALEINLTDTVAIEAEIKQNGMMHATLERANLSRANLNHGHFYQANFRYSKLNDASLVATNLSYADFSKSTLQRANLKGSFLLGSSFEGADLTGCSVYGISAWDVKLDQANQSDLIITPDAHHKITLDNLELAQFVYLLLSNNRIRSAIDTITSKLVLILGRFTAERKWVLDAIREELRKRNYVPVLFDFDKPFNRDTHETISLLARMARFVIADITEPRSIPQELGEIVPHLPTVPVQPILLEGSDEYGMFEHYRKYPWVLPVYRYTSLKTLIVALSENVIGPAEKAKAAFRP